MDTELLDAKHVSIMRKSHLSSTELTVVQQVFNAKLAANSPQSEVEGQVKLMSMKKALFVNVVDA